jgi:hypothetical protein
LFHLLSFKGRERNTTGKHRTLAFSWGAISIQAEGTKLLEKDAVARQLQGFVRGVLEWDLLTSMTRS